MSDEFYCVTVTSSQCKQQIPQQQFYNIDNQIQGATINNQRSPSQFEVLFLYNKYSCKFMYSFAYVHEAVCNSCSNFM